MKTISKAMALKLFGGDTQPVPGTPSGTPADENGNVWVDVGDGFGGHHYVVMSQSQYNRYIRDQARRNTGNVG